MCKTRRHNVKEEICDRITSLFISVNIQRNINNVSLLKKENHLYYMSQERNLSFLVCTYGKQDTCCVMA